MLVNMARKRYLLSLFLLAAICGDLVGLLHLLLIYQVIEDESAIPFLVDEAIECDCLLVEPPDHISVDGFLCFHRNSSKKCVQMEDVPCKFGEKYSFNPEEEHLLGQEELDIMPSENESGEFQAPNALFTCEDYLLDIEAGESITKLDYHLAKGSQNLVFENCTQANRAGYNGTPQELGLSATTNHVHDFHENLGMNDYDANGIFSCSADSAMSIEDRWFKYTTSFPVESIDKLEDVSSMFSNMNEKNIIFNPGLTSEEIFCPPIPEQHNEYSSAVQNTGESNIEQDVSGCPIQASNNGPPSEKRLRKPPHRFIDELSQPNSRVNRKRREISTPTSKVKTSKVKHQKHDDMKSAAEISFAEESAGKAIQVPFGPLICKESQKKQVSVAPQVLHSEPVASVAVSDEDCVSKQRKQMPIATKGLHLKPLALVTTSKEDSVSMVVKSGEDSGRRKHHILWTVSEVKKLIDGVSQYGVGRWSHIKKDLFSSSAHRTAVDLKDKWRNLLKATCVQNEGKKGEDKKRNLAWRPLPKSVVRRVRELAILYPYPRDFQTKQ